MRRLVPRRDRHYEGSVKGCQPPFADGPPDGIALSAARGPGGPPRPGAGAGRIRHNRGMEPTPVCLAFDGGTLAVTGADPGRLAALPHCRHDPRTDAYRAEARHYRALVEHLRR